MEAASATRLHLATAVGARQRQRDATNPRLPGPYRKNLPDSLRVLYGGAEKTERCLFEFLDRAEDADRYLQSFHFEHCEYCKVGWFGSALPKPGSCKVTAVDRWNFLLAPSSEWHEPGKRICRSCSEEANSPEQVFAARGSGGKAQVYEES